MNLNPLLVFLVYATNEVEALLLALEGLLLCAQLFLLLLLAANHVFHGLSFELVRLFLHFDHFCVLDALLLQAVGLVGVALGPLVLIKSDGRLLVRAHLLVALRSLAVLGLALRLQLFLLAARLLVAHADLHDLHRLFLRLLDFLPRLRTEKKPNHVA